MSVTRRQFIQSTAAGSASLSTGLAALTAARAAATPSPQDAAAGDAAVEKKRILILGGTRFLGPALVHSALAAGHEVTLFNRGRSNPHLFPDLEKLRGNRDPEIDEGLSALEGREWDAVIDTSAYVPRIARASAELLAPNVKQYVLISTISVYADPSKAPIVETDPVGTLEDETVEEITGQTYGPLKALCEQAVQEVMPERATIVRPGLIVGPEDATDRFTYWPLRIERGGEVLCPGDPDDPAQIIDVRDLADFCLRTIHDDTTGVFNAVGPAGTMTMAQMLHGCWAVTGGRTTFTWVPADFLAEHGVSPWLHMPVWLPPEGEAGGIARTSNARAIEHGLQIRPLAETVRATLTWWHNEIPAFKASLAPDAAHPTDANPNPTPRRKAGLAAEREQQVLAAWHEKQEENA